MPEPEALERGEAEEEAPQQDQAMPQAEPEAAEEPQAQAPKAEPEWKKQAPVLRVREPAPKKAGFVPREPRVVSRKESPFLGGVATAPANGGAVAPVKAEAAKLEPRPPAQPPANDHERVGKLAKAAFDEFDTAEGLVAEALEAAKPLTAGAKEVTQEMAEEAAQATETAVQAAVLRLQMASRQVAERTKEMGRTEAAIKMKSSVEFLSLHGRFKHCKSKMEELRAAVLGVRRRLTDEKKVKEQRDTFDAFDLDQDGFLSRQEVLEFASGEYGFEPAGDQVEKILRSLGGEDPGVPFERMHRLRAMVAIDKSCARAREREEKKAEIQEMAADVDKELKEAEAAAAKGKKTASGLATQRLAHLRASIERFEAETSSAKARLEAAEALVARLSEPGDDETSKDEVIKSFRDACAQEYTVQVGRIQGIVQGSSEHAEKARKRSKQAQLAEMEELRLQVACAARGAMQAKGQGPDKVFGQASGGKEAVEKEPFVAFARALADGCPLDLLPEPLRQDTIDLAKVEELFVHLAGDGGQLAKERFLRLCTRLRYVALRPTGLLQEKPGGEAGPAEVRQLAPGELLEALDLAESKAADGAKLMRCRALKDGAEGWAAVCGAEGSALIEPAGCYFTCVKETIMTTAMKITESETVRRVGRGELVEAVSDESKDDACRVVRVECKALRDGRTGWISMAGSTGQAFLELLR